MSSNAHLELAMVLAGCANIDAADRSPVISRAEAP